MTHPHPLAPLKLQVLPCLGFGEVTIASLKVTNQLALVALNVDDFALFGLVPFRYPTECNPLVGSQILTWAIYCKMTKLVTSVAPFVHATSCLTCLS